MAELSSLESVLEHLLDPVHHPVSHDVSLSDALGRVLARSVEAGMDVPPTDNSAMDGYALRLADALNGRSLPVSQRIPAGSVPQPLQPGTAARIFTGGIMPTGADVVVMQEQAQLDEASGAVSFALEALVAGRHVRRRGSDIAQGQVVLQAGQRLGAAQLALAASLGIDRLSVTPRIRVALMSTGSELQEPGQPLLPGQIYNSSRPMLKALLQALPVEVIDGGRVPDDPVATRTALRDAARQADVVITTGGVSVGEEDHVKAAVRAEGELTLWSLALKPGKPLACGWLGPARFLGLPGNPVSSLVTFLMVVRPYLLRRCGMSDVVPRRLPAIAGFDWPRPDRRREFLRVRLGTDGRLQLFPDQKSSVMTSAAWADGLVDLPAGQVIKPGDPVQYLPFSELFA